MNLALPSCNVSRENLYLEWDRDIPISSTSGLCNQLFGITTRIIESIACNIDTIIFDGFLTDISNGYLVNLSEVIDYKETTEKIKSTINKDLLFLDRGNFEFFLEKAEYGIDGISLSDVLGKITHSKNSISIKSNYNLLFQEDPVPNLSKKLYLTMKFVCRGNEYRRKVILSEGTQIDIDLSFFNKTLFEKQTRVNDFIPWNYGERNFKKFFRLLVFDRRFYQIVDSLNFSNMNVIHLRLETDMMLHLSKCNGNTSDYYRKILTDRYLEAIDNINPSLKTYIMTSEDDNIEKVFKDPSTYIYLNVDRKNELIRNKFSFVGRELSGIIDLIIGSTYGEIFVGFYSLKHNPGSTFSWALSYLRDKPDIMIDIYNKMSFNNK